MHTPRHSLSSEARVVNDEVSREYYLDQEKDGGGGGILSYVSYKQINIQSPLPKKILNY
jgi:hypothetical protein